MLLKNNPSSSSIVKLKLNFTIELDLMFIESFVCRKKQVGIALPPKTRLGQIKQLQLPIGV